MKHQSEPPSTKESAAQQADYEKLVADLEGYIEQHEFADGLRLFENVLEAMLADLPLEVLLRALACIHPIVAAQIHGSENLYTTIRVLLAGLDWVPAQLKWQFYQAAADNLVELGQTPQALQYHVLALWMMEEGGAEGEKAVEHAQLDRLMVLLRQRHLLDLFQASLPAELKEHQAAPGELLHKLLWRIDPIVTFWLQHGDHDHIDTLYTALKQVLKQFHDWADARLSVTRQQSLGAFSEVVEKILPIAEHLSRHQQWDSALSCYYFISDDVKNKLRTLSRYNPIKRYMKAKPYGFDKAPILKAIILLNGYKLKKASPPAVVASPLLWHSWKKQLQTYRAALKAHYTEDADVIKLQQRFSKQVKGLLGDIVHSIVELLGEAPCDFNLLGLGSLARGDMGPYSDIDMALLVADEAHRHHAYFQALVHLFQVSVNIIGEPNGLQVDEGDMGYLTSNDKTMLNTPKNLIALFGPNDVDNHLRPETHAIHRPTLIYSNATTDALIKEYLETLHAAFTPELRQRWAQAYSKIHAESYTDTPPSDRLDIKETYIRPLLLWCTDVALLSSIDVIAISDLFKRINSVVPNNFQRQIRQAWQSLQAQRLTQQFSSRAQADQLNDCDDELKEALQEIKQHLIRPAFIVLRLLCQSGLNINSLDPDTQQTLLTCAMQEDDVHLFITLVEFGAGRNDSAAALVAFINQHQAAIKPTLILQLSKVNKAFALERAKRHLLQLCGNRSTPKRLIDLDGQIWNWQSKVSFQTLANKRELETHRNAYGRRAVHEASSSNYHVHLKIAPEISGLELAVQSMAWAIDAQDVVASSTLYLGVQDQKRRFGSKTTLCHALQLSQHVVGENLWDILADAAKTQRLLENLDQASFTRLLLLVLMTFQEDGNPTNFIVETFTNEHGKQAFRIVCVDNDHAFLPELDEGNQLLMKSVLFCLPVMAELLDADVLLAFAVKDPQKSLRTWCEGLVERETQLLNLFPRDLRKDLYGNGKVNSSIMAIPVAGGYVPKQYQVWLSLSKIIQQRAGKLTGDECLRFVFPVVAYHYQKIRAQDEEALTESLRNNKTLPAKLKNQVASWSPSLKRYVALTLSAYDWQSGHSISRLTSKRYLDVRTLDRETIIKAPQLIGPNKALQELDSALKESEQIDHIVSELKSGKLAAFKGSYLTATKSMVLKQIDFRHDLKNEALEKKVLASLFRQSAVRLYLKGCRTLTDAQLSQLIAASPLLTHLSLEDCPKLSGKFLEASHQTPVLRSLRLVNCPSFTDWPTQWHRTTGLVFRTSQFFPLIWPSLIKLRVRHCPVTNLTLNMPSLQCLELEELPQLQHLYLDPNAQPSLKLAACPGIDKRVIAWQRLMINAADTLSFEYLMKGAHLNAQGMPITAEALIKNRAGFSGVTSADFRGCTRLGKLGLFTWLKIATNCQTIQWVNFRKQPQASPKLLQGHKRPVSTLTVLPSGELVIGSDDYTISVLDLSQRRCFKVQNWSGWVYGLGYRFSSGYSIGTEKLVHGALNSVIDMSQVTLDMYNQFHETEIFKLTVLPGGELISASLFENTLRVWDVSQRKCLQVLKGHEDAVTALVVLPTGELVSGSRDSTIRVWNVRQGKCLQVLKGHNYAVSALTVMPNGELVSGSGDCTIRVWDVSQGNCLQVLKKHERVITALTALPSGELVSGSGDCTIRVWDVRQGKCLKVLKGHEEPIFFFTLLPSGELVCGGYLDKTLRVWDVSQGRCLYVLKGHDAAVRDLVVLPSGELVSGSMDRTSRIWTFPNVTLKRDVALSEKVRGVCVLNEYGLDLLADDDSMLNGDDVQFALDQYTSAMTDGTPLTFKPSEHGYRIYLSDPVEKLRCLQWLCSYFPKLDYELKCLTEKGLYAFLPWLEQHAECCRGVVYFPKAAPASASCIRHLIEHGLNLAQLSWRQQIVTKKSKSLNCHVSHVMALTMLHSGELVSGSDDKTIRVWDVSKGECLKVLKGHDYGVSALTVLPSGELVSGSYDKTLRVWDVSKGECLKVLRGHEGEVLALTVLPTGELVSGSDDKTIRVWDVSKGECLKVLKGHDYGVSALTVLPSGELVSGSLDCTIRVWDVSEGECLKVLEGHDGSIYALTLLPTGKIVSDSSDNSLRVWDVRQGRNLQVLKGHIYQEDLNIFRALTVLQSGELVSGSEDCTLKVWDVSREQCLHELGHGGSVCALTVLPTGELVSGSADGTIRIWRYHQAMVHIDFTEIDHVWHDMMCQHTNDSLILQLLQPSLSQINAVADLAQKLVGFTKNYITEQTASRLTLANLFPEQVDCLVAFFEAIKRRRQKQQHLRAEVTLKTDKSSFVRDFLSSGHGAQSMEERIAVFESSARAIIDMYRDDFTMARMTEKKIHIELPALDDPRYGAPIFGSEALLQETLEEFKDYIVTALGKQGLVYAVTENRLVITAVSPEKAQAVENFFRQADCWFEEQSQQETKTSDTTLGA